MGISDFGLTPVEVTTPYDRRAKRLFAILSQYRRLTRRQIQEFNQATWARHIRLLVERDRVSIEGVDLILNWLEDHLHDKYTPRVFSAASFRSKFDRLWEAMRRCDSDQVVAISPEIESLCNRLGLIWPQDEKEHEKTFAQKCYENYTEIASMIRKTSTNKKVSARLRGLCKWINQAMPPARVFAENWLIKAHRVAHNWPKWQGSKALKIFRVELDNRHFEDQIEIWALGFCTNFDMRWNDLKRIWKVAAT
jgi:hypothetical protein